MSADTGEPHEHPSPHRERVSVVGLLFALAIGPAAWAAQLMVSYGLSSYACFPFDRPHLHAPPPGWSGERATLVAISLVALLFALGGLWWAYRSWRAVQGEKAGTHHTLFDVGEGRSRFLAACGMLATSSFALAILFGLAAAAAVPSCWEFGP